METLKSASKSVKDAIDSSLENTATASQNAISAQLSPSTTKSPKAKDPGHPYAKTKHISFTFHDQTNSPAPFGYEYYVSLPPAYHSQLEKSWPLILFLHGAGESQRAANESYASLRHGVPKVILCYDKWKDGMKVPSIDIPLAPRLRRAGKNTDKSSEPVDPEVCRLVAEEFITVTPSLNMDYGYGWNAPILSALLTSILSSYRIDSSRLHLTGFSMGGYGTWALALHSITSGTSSSTTSSTTQSSPPPTFATLAPICGGGDALRAPLIKDIPHWVHHGDLDDIIPVTQSIQMVNALNKAGAQEVKFSRYPDLMHDSWTKAYSDIELWKWMSERRRG